MSRSLSSPSPVTARRLGYGVATAALATALIITVTRHGAWSAFALGLLGPDIALFFGAGRGLARG